MWRDSAQTKFDGIWDAEVKHDGPNCEGHEEEFYPITISPDQQPQLPLNPATGTISGYYPMLPSQRAIQLYSGKLNEAEGSGKGEWYNPETGCLGMWVATKRPQRNPSKIIDKTSSVLNLAHKSWDLLEKIGLTCLRLTRTPS